MHLTMIIAFAALLWFSTGAPAGDGRGAFNFLSLDAAYTVACVLGVVCVVWGLSWWSTQRVLRSIRTHPDDPNEAQHLHHEWSFILQIIILVCFLGLLLLTSWPQTVRGWVGSSDLYGLDDAMVILPLFASILGMWIVQYPVDRAIRELALGPRLAHGQAVHPVWTLGQYLSFNIRFHILTVALPMSLIIIGADALDRFREPLREWSRVYWINDFAMGVLVCIVFALAPLMMRYTWTTEPLPAGDLRQRLEGMAGRMRLRYRDILVWHSRGMLVNAAVMGILPPVRYVLLSDGLLEAMSDRQIEAVFGHEAGHVRFWHIPYFIVFATLSMLIGGGVLMLVDPLLPIEYSQLVVGAVIVLMWGVVFGWLSHQFEYQADLAGARSISPNARDCHHPCAVHADSGSPVEPGDSTAPPEPARSSAPPEPGALCLTGAKDFSAALLRVAALNGIPRDERGWRHPSIDQRIRFLEQSSRDPSCARRFARSLKLAKIGLVGGTSFGLAIATWLYWGWLWARVP